MENKNIINENIRFETELEFVQLLSNASYLNYLAQYKYFDDPTFINYLKYLQYWKTPKYIKYISYPHCLYFLEMLQNENFREECKKPAFTNLITQQQGFLWKFYQKKKIEPDSDNSGDVKMKESVHDEIKIQGENFNALKHFQFEK